MRSQLAQGFVMGIAIGFSLGVPIGLHQGNLLQGIFLGILAGLVMGILFIRNGDAKEQASAVTAFGRTPRGEPIMYPKCPECGEDPGPKARCQHCQQLILSY